MDPQQISVLIAAFCMLVGYVWALVLAFRASLAWGLAFLLLPLAWPVFIVRHWQDARQPGVLLIGGLARLAFAFYQGSLWALPPGQMPARQAASRQAEMADAETQRKARQAQQRNALAEAQAQAERTYAELAPRRAALPPGDATALAAFKVDAARYEALLARIRAIRGELQFGYYVKLVPADSSLRTPAEKSALTYRDEDLVELEPEAVSIRNQISETTDPMLAARRFAELDALAAQLRASKADTSAGTWHLRCLYNGITRVRPYLPEEAWKERIATLQAWVEQRPQSVTARVALADTWCDWAWRARGYEYAHKVTAPGWKLFAERLKVASDALAAARPLAERCPVWWDVALRVALGQSWDRARYEALYEEAIRFEPRYFDYHAHKQNFLLPRWRGQPGENAAFIRSAADRVGGEAGNVLYARLIWDMNDSGMFDGGFVIKAMDASWPRVRAGLEAILRQRPDSIPAASELCYLLGQQGEAAPMRALFAQIGPLVDTGVFGDSKRFLRDRSWAFQHR